MYYENNNAYFMDKMSSSVLLGMCGVTVVGMHAKLNLKQLYSLVPYIVV